MHCASELCTLRRIVCFVSITPDGPYDWTQNNTIQKCWHLINFAIKSIYPMTEVSVIPTLFNVPWKFILPVNNWAVKP